MTQINNSQILSLCDIKITLSDQTIQDLLRQTAKYKVEKFPIMMSVEVLSPSLLIKKRCLLIQIPKDLFQLKQKINQFQAPDIIMAIRYIKLQF